MYATPATPLPSQSVTSVPPNVAPYPFWNYVYNGPPPQAVRPAMVESVVAYTNLIPHSSGQKSVKILPNSRESRPSARTLLRKQTKPETEKRRRQRINRALEQLKQLVNDKTSLPSSGFEKVEKADILEHAVMFIRKALAVNTDQSLQSADVTKAAQSIELARMFLYGFVSCESNILQICNNLLNTVQCNNSTGCCQPPLRFLSEVFSKMLADLTKKRGDALIGVIELPSELACVIPSTALTNNPSTSSPASTDSAPEISPQQLTRDSGLAIKWNTSPIPNPDENSCHSFGPRSELPKQSVSTDWPLNCMEGKSIQNTGLATQHTEVWRPW